MCLCNASVSSIYLFVHIRMNLVYFSSALATTDDRLGRVLLLRSALFVSNAAIAFSCRVYGAAVWHW